MSDSSKKKWRTPAVFFRTLVEEFTPKFVALLGIYYFLVKGIGFNIVTRVELPLYQSLSVSAESYQKFFGIGQIGFAIKPLLGTISDAIPIRGFHKKWYMAGSSALGVLALCLILAVPRKASSAAGVAVLIFVTFTAMAFQDLLCEGAYTRIMQSSVAAGSSAVTWVWWMYSIGNLIAAIVEGTLADQIDPFTILSIVAPMFLFVAVPSVLGWLPERRVQNSLGSAGTSSASNEQPEGSPILYESSSANSSGRQPGEPLSPIERCFPATITWSREQVNIVKCGVLVGFVAIGLAVVQAAVDDSYVLAGYLLFTFFATLGVGYRYLPKLGFQVMSFLFIKSLLYTKINPILDYWYTAKPDCVPGGPEFSYTYYQTVGSIIKSVAQLAGVFLFEAVLTKLRFRTIFYITTALLIVSSLIDLVIIERWNIDVGIPDKAMWLMGDEILGEVVYMLDIMPSIILMSRACPKGVEATMFAVVAGSFNFGINCSFTLGYLLTKLMEVSTPDEGDADQNCYFENLPALLILCHMLLPLLIPVLIWFTIPDIHVSTKTAEILESPPELDAAAAGVRSTMGIDEPVARTSLYPPEDDASMHSMGHASGGVGGGCDPLEAPLMS